MEMTERTDKRGCVIRALESEQVPVTDDQAAQLEGVNNLLRYCERCRNMWKWKGGPDPCPRCN